MDKIHPTHDTDNANGWRTVVTAKFSDGKEMETFVEGLKGIMPPASNEDVVQKWRILVQVVVDEKRMEEIEKSVLGLENIGDVSELLRLLEDTVNCPIVV